MEQHLFDDIFREKLYNHVSPVSPGLWDKIAEKKPKRLKPIVYWSTASVLFLGLLIGYYFVNETQPKNYDLIGSGNNVQATVSSKIDKDKITYRNPLNVLFAPILGMPKVHNAEKDNQKSNDEYFNSPILERDVDNKQFGGHSENKGLETREKIKHILQSDSNKEENPSYSSNSSKHYRNNTTNSSLAYTKKETLEKGLFGQNLPTYIPTNKYRDGRTRLKVQNNISYHQNDSEIRTKSEFPQSSVITSTKDLKIQLDSLDNFNANWKQSERAQTYIKAILLDSSFDFNSLLPKAKVKTNNTTVHIDTKKKRKSLWYIEGYASPNIDRQNFVSNGASQQFLHSKDSSEKMLVGGSIGIRLTKTIGKHFSVKAGIQISQSNQLFKLRTDNVINTTSTVTQGAYINPSGKTITYSDTTTFFQKGFYINTYYNTYRNLELPICVTYDVSWHSWQFSIGLGTAINLSSTFKGQTLGNNSQIVPLSAKIAGGTYSSNIQSSILGNITIIKNLSHNLALFAEPYYKTNLEGTSSYQFGFVRKQQTIGCNLGVRLFFGTTK